MSALPPILLPRVIRLDRSDMLVFPRMAEPDELAVAGGFLFWDADPHALAAKDRIALRSGFLGVASFGFSTLVAVAEVTPAQRAAAVMALAENLVHHLGAPDAITALPAAAEEVAHAARLCVGHAPNTVLALARTIEGGAVRESFRSLSPRPPGGTPAPFQLPVFSVLSEEADAEPMDLLTLPEARDA